MKHLGANGLKIPLHCSLPFLLATPYSLSWTLEGLTWVPLRALSLALLLLDLKRLIVKKNCRKDLSWWPDPDCANSSVIHRNLDCEIDEDKKRDGYYYNCSIMPLFELGSLHHDYYLVNLRIPSAFDYEGHSVNVDSKIGRLVDLWLVGIHQVFWSLSQFSTGLFCHNWYRPWSCETPPCTM